MSNLENKLAYILDTKKAIKQAIENKGVAIKDDDTFRSYADKINNIETGMIVNKISQENRMMYHVRQGTNYIYSKTQKTGAYPNANYIVLGESGRQTSEKGCFVYNRQNGKYKEFTKTPELVEYEDKVILLFTDCTEVYNKDFVLEASFQIVGNENAKLFTNGILWISNQTKQFFINLKDNSVAEVSINLSNSSYYNMSTRIMLDDTHFLYAPYSLGVYLIDIETKEVVWSISKGFYSYENSVNGACFQSVYGETHYKVDNFIFSVDNSLYGWNNITKTIDKIYTGVAAVQTGYTIYRRNEEEKINELVFETTYQSATNYIACKYLDGQLKIIAQYSKEERDTRGYPSAYYNQILFVSRGYYKGGSFVYFPDMEDSTYAYYTRVVEKDNYLFMITSGGTMYVGDKYLNTIREVLTDVRIDPFEYPEHLHCYHINGAYVILSEDDRVDYCTDAGMENDGINNRIVVYCPTTEVATQYHIRDTKSTMGNFTTFSMNLIEFNGGCYIVPREVQYGELDGTMGDYDTRERRALKIICDSKSSSCEETSYRGGTRIAKGLYILGPAWTGEADDNQVIVTDYRDPNNVQCNSFERINTLTYLNDFDWWNMRNYVVQAKDNHDNVVYLFGKDPDNEEVDV